MNDLFGDSNNSAKYQDSGRCGRLVESLLCPLEAKQGCSLKEVRKEFASTSSSQTWGVGATAGVKYKVLRADVTGSYSTTDTDYGSEHLETSKSVIVPRDTLYCAWWEADMAKKKCIGGIRRRMFDADDRESCFDLIECSFGACKSASNLKLSA